MSRSCWFYDISSKDSHRLQKVATHAVFDPKLAALSPRTVTSPILVLHRLYPLFEVFAFLAGLVKAELSLWDRSATEGSQREASLDALREWREEVAGSSAFKALQAKPPATSIEFVSLTCSQRFHEINRNDARTMLSFILVGEVADITYSQ